MATLTPTTGGGFLLPSSGLLGVSGNSAPGVKATSPYGNLNPISTTLPISQTQTTAPIKAPQSTSGGTTGVSTGVGGTSTLSSTDRANIEGQLTTDKALLANLQSLQAQQSTGGGTTSTGTPPATLGGVASTLATTAGTSSPQYQQAQAAYTQAYNQLQTLQTQAAQAQGSVQNTPGISLGAAAGQSGQIQNLLANEEAPLSQEMSAAQTSAGMATAQQGTQQTGLIGAANALQPQTQYGALTNPATGQPISSSAVVSGASSLPAAAQSALALLPQTAQQAIMTEAQKIQNNQESQQTGISNLSAYGQAGLTALNAILGPNFNANTNAGASAGQTAVAGAGGQAQASNIVTAGTAGVTANQQVFNAAYATYTQLQNTVSNVDQFGSLLTSGMTSTDGTPINPSELKYANQTLANIRNQLSTPEQATYDTTLAALKGKISGLLSVGGNEIPSQVTADANKILDGSLPLGSLNAVLARIQAEGNILLQNQALIVNNAYAGIQNGGTSTSGSSSGSSGSVTAGGYTYTQNAQGQWVASS